MIKILLMAMLAPTLTATPRTVQATHPQVVAGRHWPVNEFCRRRVVLYITSGRFHHRIGPAGVTTHGRFRRSWTPGPEGAPRTWTLHARMRCESGRDGSVRYVRRATRIRVTAA
jgi:hypothetical protein